MYLSRADPIPGSGRWNSGIGSRGQASASVVGQASNGEFERFDFYYAKIEADHAQPDGSHEVLAIASGKFADSTKRMKVLFLIVDSLIVGAQVLEGTHLPPCLAPEHRSSSSL